MIKACLNGPRLPGAHPALPVTPAALAAEAAAVRAAGAAAVHVHAKDADGRDTLDGAAVAAVLDAVRAAAPGLPVGVTTGAWAAPEPEQRLAAIRGWSVLPDFASVNWHEPGAEEVAALLLERGVGVEAGLWTPDAVDAWLASPLRGRCLRVLVEVIGPDERSGADVRPLADRMLDRLAGADHGLPVLLHGEGRGAWPLVRLALARGLDTRVGLEDTLVLPDGRPAPGSAALVAAAAASIRA